jgi:hypothetical protein
LDFPLDPTESDTWFQQEDQLNQLLNTIDPSVLTLEEAKVIAGIAPSTDTNLWVYEWLRYFTSELLKY